MGNPVKVFISYSWDSDEHKAWVLSLAKKLANDGVYVILDQYDLVAGKNMTQYMESSVDEADKVLCILTKSYKTKADNRTGGVGYEYSMITQELFSTQTTNTKFIPVRREGTYNESAPKFLGVLISQDMTDDAKFEASYTELRSTIYNQPIIERPPLGKAPSFLTLNVPSKLIDDNLNLSKTGMTQYSNWKFIITLSSSQYDVPEFFKLLKENLELDNKIQCYLPHIANDFFRVKQHPTVEYEFPLKQHGMVANKFTNEKLQILPSKLAYEFSEYSNQNLLLLNLSLPLTSILFLLIAINKIQRSKSSPINLSVEAEYTSNGKSTLHQDYSPFDFGFILEPYSIPDNHFKTTVVFDKIDINILYNFYQKLYNAFICDNPKSRNPYVTLNENQFKELVTPYLPKNGTRIAIV